MVKKHHIIFFVLFLSFLFEAINGALRYFLDIFGIGSFIYLPKILMMLAIGLMFSIKINLKILVLLGVVLWYVPYSLTNVPFLAFAFGFYMLLPLFFGALYASRYYLEKDILIAFKTVFILSVVGIWLDVFFTLPWEGYTQQILGFEIEGSRKWSIMEIDRPAGFSRLSAAAAIMISISSIFYIVSSRKLISKFFIFLLTFATLIATTNKSAIVGFILTAPLLIKTVRKYFMSTSIVLAILIGILLPLLSIYEVIDFVIDLKNPVEVALLDSFRDRILNTWPTQYNMFLNFSNENFLVKFFGLGIGGFGSGSRIFGAGLGVADNSWLYVFFLVGIFGFFMMIYCSYVALQLSKLKDNMLVAYGLAFNLTLWLGITTDIFESLITSFLIGYVTFLPMRKVSNLMMETKKAV